MTSAIVTSSDSCVNLSFDVIILVKHEKGMISCEFAIC
jgi:hypothetical protein